MFIHPNILPGGSRIVRPIGIIADNFRTYARLGFSFVELIGCPSGQYDLDINLVYKRFEM